MDHIFNFVPSPDLLLDEKVIAGEKFQVYRMGDYRDDTNFDFFGLIRVREEMLESIAVVRCILNDLQHITRVADVYAQNREPLNAPQANFIGRAILFDDATNKRSSEPLGYVLAEDSNNTYDVLIDNPCLMLFFTETILKFFKEKFEAPVYFGFARGYVADAGGEDDEFFEGEHQEKLFSTLAACGYKIKTMPEEGQIVYESKTVAYFSTEMLNEEYLRELYSRCSVPVLEINEKNTSRVVNPLNDPAKRAEFIERLEPFIEVDIDTLENQNAPQLIRLASHTVHAATGEQIDIDIYPSTQYMEDEEIQLCKAEPNPARIIYWLAGGTAFFAEIKVSSGDKKIATMALPLEFWRCKKWSRDFTLAMMDGESAEAGEIAWQMFCNWKVNRKPFPRENIVSSTGCFLLTEGDEQIINSASVFSAIAKGITHIFSVWPSRGGKDAGLREANIPGSTAAYFVHLGKIGRPRAYYGKTGHKEISDDKILAVAKQVTEMATFCCTAGMNGDESNFLVVYNNSYTIRTKAEFEKIPWKSRVKQITDYCNDYQDEDVPFDGVEH